MYTLSSDVKVNDLVTLNLTFMLKIKLFLDFSATGGIHVVLYKHILFQILTVTISPNVIMNDFGPHFFRSFVSFLSYSLV